MRALICALAAAALAVPGCAVRHSVSARQAAASLSAQASVSALTNAMILDMALGDAIQYYGLGPDGRMQVGPSELDPDRKVNLQDCTRPVDPSAGNLMCR